MSWITRNIARFGGEFGQAFRSLANANYRIYTFGQLVSLTGTHLQSVALSWTAYQVTGSASLLGIITLATYAPVLFLSLLGGMMADRFDRRKILIWNQVAGLLISAALAACTLTGCVNFWILFGFSLCLGIASAIEMPVRHSFVFDVVGENNMVNAVALNSLVFNSARLLGPAMAAILLPLTGSGICFALNSASFLAAIFTLRKVQTTSGNSAHGADGTSFLDAVRLAFYNPRIRNILIITGCATGFVYQHIIMLPIVVDKTLHGSAVMLGFLTSAAAFGSVVGGLFLASRGRKEILPKIIAWGCFGPGFFLLIFSACSSLVPTVVSIALLHMFYAIQIGSSNSYLQLTVPSQYRGRVMSLYSSILVGSVPAGSLLVGYLTDHVGVSWALAVCAVASLLSSFFYITCESSRS